MAGMLQGIRKTRRRTRALNSLQSNQSSCHATSPGSRRIVHMTIPVVGTFNSYLCSFTHTFSFQFWRFIGESQFCKIALSNFYNSDSNCTLLLPSAMSTTYSDFFSSGLSASSHAHNKTHSPPSPGFLSSPDVTHGPLSMDEDSDVENLDITLDVNSARGPMPTTDSGKSRSVYVGSTRQNAQRPHLRRRRSSLTYSASPMNMIKSPQRSASHAFLFQQRLPQTGSLGYSCNESSGYLGSDGLSTTADRSDDSSVASQNLFSRMRSGSVGSFTLSR